MAVSDFQITLPFGSVEEEVDRKLGSMLVPPKPIRDELEVFGAKKLDDQSRKKLSDTLAFVYRLEPENEHHPSMIAYLSHPLRVACCVAQMMSKPCAETIEIALMHNLFEITSLTKIDLRDAGYSKRIQTAIGLLTIDRRYEEDPEYLAGFYSAIEGWGPALSLVRCCDKLDNLFGAQIIEDPSVKSSYVALAKQFVAPMAYRLSKPFGDYFTAVAEFQETAGYRPDCKDQLDRFIAQHMA
ncbi:hypothetical protein [Aestuariispira insulae]|uniref:HD domain-containing protein n=1 Tax=Aestuariispira insulae TaxID=1461337 RepID=A0A3D9H540_9PROT|nr:hypothetical protein [Aestuariispira insulae]RED44291.1 hypothetical protein DFP90_11544 [Aestuariispira insulae]